MPKYLKVYYAGVPNMGDRLNVPIIENLFGYKVRKHTYLTGELSAIGSGLGQFAYSDNRMVSCFQRLAGAFFPNVVVWGTGFICNQGHDNEFYRKNITFSAVRGELSKRRVEIILGRKLDIPTGDAGILSSFLLNEDVCKKHEVGIIAHLREVNTPSLQCLLEHYPNSTFIDVRKPPLDVIRQIAECKCIISSSLHGLIIADSLRIPNLHVVLTDNLKGDGFKFNDYYSAYGMEHKFVDLRSCSFPAIERVYEDYAVSDSIIEEKKKEMIECFPYPNNYCHEHGCICPTPM